MGRKVVVGSQGGVLLLYSWGCWADCSDRAPGHPQSVDALLKVCVCGGGDQRGADFSPEGEGGGASPEPVSGWLGKR